MNFFQKTVRGIFYYKDKEMTIFHREDGPAIESVNGDKEWWLNGKLHREDGPACVFFNGTKIWFIHGKRHREDGPAVEYVNVNYANVNKEYWFENKRYDNISSDLYWIKFCKMQRFK